MPERDETSPPPWKTHNPFVSGVLAFLVPGAGHFYQGRHFKAAIYMVCILGSFFYGTSLAGWRAVSYDTNPPPGGRRGSNWGFIAQFGVGLPTLTAFWQSSRYDAQRTALKLQPGDVHPLNEAIAQPFEGLYGDTPVRGRIEIVPAEDGLGSLIAKGIFVGETADGRPVELEIEGDAEVEPALYARKERMVFVDVDGDQTLDLQGVVPRPFLDWYQIPIEHAEEQALHQQLGKTYELALVYTWIAGLLNVLAVWDCVEGPAYGIGDEPEDEDDEGASAAKAESKPAEKAPAAPAKSETAS